jgi:hypothetical protein
VVADHEARIKLLGKIVHLESLLKAVYGSLRLIDLLPVGTEPVDPEEGLGYTKSSQRGNGCYTVRGGIPRLNVNRLSQFTVDSFWLMTHQRSYLENPQNGTAIKQISIRNSKKFVIFMRESKAIEIGHDPKGP